MLTRRSLACIAAALTLAACSKPDPGASSHGGAIPLPVKLALDWVPEPEFGGFYAARGRGDFKKEGLDVEIQGGGSGVPVVQMVATGKADFGSAGADEVLTARARGAEVIPVFAVYQKSPQGIMVHASRGVKTLAAALSSGSLAIEPGVSFAAFLKKKYGFDKVKVVPYDGGVARFLTDKDLSQQCYVTSEPLAATKKGGDPQVFLAADEGWNPYVGVIFTRAALWKEKPEMVKAFVRAARAGWRAYLDDPKPANEVMRSLNGAMDEATFAGAAAAQKALIEPAGKGKIGEMTKERWATLGRQMVELDLVDSAAVPEVVGVE